MKKLFLSLLVSVLASSAFAETADIFFCESKKIEVVSSALDDWKDNILDHSNVILKDAFNRAHQEYTGIQNARVEIIDETPAITFDAVGKNTQIKVLVKPIVNIIRELRIHQTNYVDNDSLGRVIDKGVMCSVFEANSFRTTQLGEFELVNLESNIRIGGINIFEDFIEKKYSN